MARKRRRLPSSGDRLTDWHFRQIVDVLERVVKAVRKKKRLIDLDDKPPRKAVRGLNDLDLAIIYLNAAKKIHPTSDDYVETIIHEAFHTILEGGKPGHKGIIRHEAIDVIAEILIKKFTDEQKRYLKKFIPRKEVKRGPLPTQPDASDAVSKKPSQETKIPDVLLEDLNFPDLDERGPEETPPQT